MRRYSHLFVLAACVLAFSIVLLVPALQVALPAENYVPLHTLLEFSSIVVSFSVFSVGWYSYKQTRNRQDLIIAGIYLTIGLLDLAHTLSYKGMPEFLGPNTAGKAAAYWLVARFFDGAALLGAAFIGPGIGKRNRSWAPFTIVIPIAITSIVVFLITIDEHAIGHALFKPESGLTNLKIGIEYLIILLYVGAYAAFGSKKRWGPASTHSLQMALIFSVFAEMAFTRYISPYDGANLLGHIFKVVSNYLVLQALFVLSLERPYDEARMHQQAYEHEHEIAETLQKSFLPTPEKPPQGFQIAHRYKGAREEMVGGDFYDIFMLSDGRVAIMMGDVSGKGIPAAIHTVMAKYSLRAFAQEDPEPLSVIPRLNTFVCSQLKDGYFITLFYGLLDTSSGQLTYVNAGHEQPVLVKGRDYTALDSTGPILGVMPGLPFEQAEISLTPGDKFILMTDGITEARILGVMFGVEGVGHTASLAADETAEDVVDRIYEIVGSGGALRDDAAMIVIRRLPES